MAQQTARVAPPFRSVHSAGINPESGNLNLRFIAENGQMFQISLVPEILPATVTAIISHGEQLSSDQQSIDAQPLLIQGFQKFSGPEGLVGLALITQEGFRLPVIFPENALVALRNVASELEELARSKAPKPH